MKYLLLIISIVLISCSPQKKLQKLIEKHPELVKTDTVNFTDTLYTSSIFTDTIFSRPLSERDTITLVKEKLKVQIITKKDSIYVSGSCESDTIYIDKNIPVEKLLPCPPLKEKTFWEKAKDAAVWIIIGAGAVIILLIFVRR